MLTNSGPKVLEFNCRFGDPETQVILPLLNCDLYPVLQACVSGTLQSQRLEFIQNKSAVGTVLISEGYPGTYSKGLEITGMKQARPSYVLFIIIF